MFVELIFGVCSSGNKGTENVGITYIAKYIYVSLFGHQYYFNAFLGNL